MWQRALALDVTLARKAWPACQRSLTLRSLRISFLTLCVYHQLRQFLGNADQTNLLNCVRVQLVRGRMHVLRIH